MLIELSVVGALICIVSGLAMGIQFAVLRMRTKPSDRGKSVDNPGIIVALIFDWIGLLFYGGRMVAGVIAPSVVGASTPLALITGFAYWLIFAAAIGLGYEVSLRLLEDREKKREARGDAPEWTETK